MEFSPKAKMPGDRSPPSFWDMVLRGVLRILISSTFFCSCFCCFLARRGRTTKSEQQQEKILGSGRWLFSCLA